MSPIVSHQLALAAAGAPGKWRQERPLDNRSRQRRHLNAPPCGVADDSATTVATTRAEKCRMS